MNRPNDGVFSRKKAIERSSKTATKPQQQNVPPERRHLRIRESHELITGDSNGGAHRSRTRDLLSDSTIPSALAGVRTLTFDSDVLSRQVSLKNRVWQRRLLVPVESYTRKTLGIGR